MTKHLDLLKAAEPLIEVTFCKYCDEKHPIDIEVYSHPEDGDVVTCYCSVTDQMLNDDEDLVIEYMTPSEIKEELGWVLEETIETKED